MNQDHAMKIREYLPDVFMFFSTLKRGNDCCIWVFQFDERALCDIVENRRITDWLPASDLSLETAPHPYVLHKDDQTGLLGAKTAGPESTMVVNCQYAELSYLIGPYFIGKVGTTHFLIDFESKITIERK